MSKDTPKLGVPFMKSHWNSDSRLPEKGGLLAGVNLNNASNFLRFTTRDKQSSIPQV